MNIDKRIAALRAHGEWLRNAHPGARDTIDAYLAATERMQQKVDQLEQQIAAAQPFVKAREGSPEGSAR